jgi:hypothetical protein
VKALRDGNGKRRHILEGHSFLAAGYGRRLTEAPWAVSSEVVDFGHPRPATSWSCCIDHVTAVGHLPLVILLGQQDADDPDH